MDGDKRREDIINILSGEVQPMAGNELAARLGVSRQVIVQDIALLRAVNKNILATNKGYVLFRNAGGKEGVKKSIKVRHKNSQILEELFTIVDLGGKVLDVVVEHPIYGQITVDLVINNRTDAENFVEQVKKNGTKPLNDLTQGIHYHTIETDKEETAARIEGALREKGYLIN